MGKSDTRIDHMVCFVRLIGDIVSSVSFRDTHAYSVRDEQLFTKFAHMKSSFPKRDKPHSKTNKWARNANAKFIESVLVTSFSHTYVYVYIFMKSSFSKYDLQTWHWHCKLDLWIVAYCVFEKSSSYSF